MVRRVLGVVVGSILYRLLYAAALRFNVPADYMKLVSAVIVAAAIAALRSGGGPPSSGARPPPERRGRNVRC